MSLLLPVIVHSQTHLPTSFSIFADPPMDSTESKDRKERLQSIVKAAEEQEEASSSSSSSSSSDNSSDDSSSSSSTSSDDDSDSSSTSSSSDSSSDESDMNDATDGKRKSKTQRMIFRNYRPFHQNLHEYVLPPQPVLEDANWVDEEIRTVVEKAHATSTADAIAVNIAPKKANWDLKRDIAPKLEILQARTQKAIVDIVRNKITQERSMGS